VKGGWSALVRLNAAKGKTELPLTGQDLPVKEIANALAERAGELGLTWRLVPATVSPPGPGGVMRVTLDGDTEAIDAVTMIGRLPVDARVFVIMSPPAGVHIVGFLGYDFPPSVSGEAIGRPRLIELITGYTTPASSTAMNDVPGMNFTGVANGRYVVRLRASHTGASAADIKYSWTAPGGATMDRYVLTIPTGELTNFNPTTWTNARRSLGDQQGSAITQAVAPSTAFPGHWEDCIVRLGATGGTVQLQAGQNTSDVNPSIVRSGTYMEVQRYR
jgi:hypothetical protein